MRVHRLGDEQDGIDQGGFAAGGVADDGYRAYLRDINWHVENLRQKLVSLLKLRLARRGEAASD
jgi:hypothetical protein